MARAEVELHPHGAISTSARPARSSSRGGGMAMAATAMLLW